MGLVLLVLKGPQKDEYFHLEPGARLGRSDCDITLRDSKVSNHHATVEASENGALLLVDAGSSNGIKIDGLKMDSIELVPGTTFQIGPFILRVIDEEDLSKSNDDLEEWRKGLVKLVKKVESFGSRKPTSLAAFENAIRLSADFPSEAYTLGYGPREVGNHSSDVLFFLPSITNIWFTIEPDKDGRAIFVTEMPELVKLNNVSVAKQILDDGDIIHFHGRKIKVELIK